jgi:hypothetical protein
LFTQAVFTETHKKANKSCNLEAKTVNSLYYLAELKHWQLKKNCFSSGHFVTEGESARKTTSRNLRKSAEDYTTDEMSAQC